MSTDLVPVAAAAAVIPAQSDNDQQLVEMWIARSSSPHTKRNYRLQANRFLAAAAKPLQSVSLKDVQAYMESTASLAPSSRALAVSVLKSLLTFGHEIA